MRKPKIVISECLNGKKCRYDGQGYNDKVIKELKDYIHMETVCPEVAIGLATPRKPIRIEKHKEKEEYKLIDYDSQNDYTNQILEFSDEFLNNLTDVDGFILKSKSPTCGIKDVKIYYQGNKCSIRNNGSGFFSQKIMDAYNYLPIENEGRLKNYSIRDNFFTKIFLINNLKETKDIKDFHCKNLLLLKSYNKEDTNKLSQLLEKENLGEDIISKYKKSVYEIISKERNKNEKLSVIMSIFEKYKSKLSLDEVNMFEDIVRSYQKGKTPFSTLAVAIRMYATRFSDKEVLNQSFFNPYPEELINITDSGKGRKL